MKSFDKISQSRLKSYSKLTNKKFRQSERKFLVEGVRLVNEALKSDWEVECVILSKGVGENGDEEKSRITETMMMSGVPIFECFETELEKLSDTVTSQGIVAVVKMKEYSLKEFWKKRVKHLIFVALDDIADPGNVGTILRTCDWFGVDSVLLSKNTVDLFNAKVVRGTMGAIFHIPILPEVDLGLMMQNVKKLGFKIITTVLDGGKPLSKFSFPDKSIIVFGNEARGVSKEIEPLADESITINKYGKAESLNVAISCGIILNAARASKYLKEF